MGATKQGSVLWSIYDKICEIEIPKAFLCHAFGHTPGTTYNPCAFLPTERLARGIWYL